MVYALKPVYPLILNVHKNLSFCLIPLIFINMAYLSHYSSFPPIWAIYIFTVSVYPQYFVFLSLFFGRLINDTIPLFVDVMSVIYLHFSLSVSMIFSFFPFPCFSMLFPSILSSVSTHISYCSNCLASFSILRLFESFGSAASMMARVPRAVENVGSVDCVMFFSHNRFLFHALTWETGERLTIDKIARSLSLPPKVLRKRLDNLRFSSRVPVLLAAARSVA